MSKTVKKTVTISESQLVNLIEDIANKAVVSEKKKWIAEQAKSSGALLESKLASLEKKVQQLSKNK